MKKKAYRRLKPRLDRAGEGYPMPMRGLLALGRPKQDQSYVEWAEQLREYVPQLIQMALDPDLNERDEHDKALWAPIHALHVLTALSALEAVDSLLAMLESHDDWVTDQLIEFYAAVGPDAVPPLQKFAADADHAVGGRGLALASLGAIAARHADQRAPIIQFLTGFLHRPEADTKDEETVTAWDIVALLDLEEVETLPEIRRAFEQDRVDTSMITLDQVERELSDTGETEEEDAAEDPAMQAEARAKEPLTLILKCKACGREREYTFERAYYDVGTAKRRSETEDSPLVVPQRVVCSKCGAVDQYELGGLSTFAVLAKLMSRSSGLPDPLPRLELVDFTTERWGWIPPRQVLPRYEAELALHGDDLQLRMGYANALRMMGYREQATDEYERVLMGDPNNGDVLFALAQMQSESGSIPAAIQAWEAIERRFDELWLPREERALRRQEIQQTLAELRSGVRPDYHGKLIPIDDGREPKTVVRVEDRLPRPVSSDFDSDYPVEPMKPAPSPYGKVGRNDRCPCGSGKKYKQCHGRR